MNSLKNIKNKSITCYHNIFLKTNSISKEKKFSEKSDIVYIFANISKVWLKRRQLIPHMCFSTQSLVMYHTK